MKIVEDISGVCPLCEQPLGCMSKCARIPRFDFFKKSFGNLQSFAGKLVHHDCMLLWEDFDRVVENTIECKSYEYRDGKKVNVLGDVNAWYFENPDEDQAHGLIYFPRSVKYFYNRYGVDIDECEIRLRTNQIKEIAEVLKFREGEEKISYKSEILSVEAIWNTFEETVMIEIEDRIHYNNYLCKVEIRDLVCVVI